MLTLVGDIRGKKVDKGRKRHGQQPKEDYDHDTERTRAVPMRTSDELNI